MQPPLTGNLLVAQSGGPTAVINASLAGVITEALNHSAIQEIYGGLNGVLGIMQGRIINLAEQSQQTIRSLRLTPGAALGTCRYKLSSEQDFESLIQVFEAYQIRHFLYIGGNDSQDTTHKIALHAEKRGYPLQVMGIPKTIDNDLILTDHCPGYGSAIKYIATTVREMARDHEGMGQGDLVSILEVMGRNTGWLAAGSVLARRRGYPEDAPHLVYLPELAFDPEAFLEDVKGVLQKQPYCLVVVSEGLVDADNNYVAQRSAFQDQFGHTHLGGVGEYLQALVEERLGGVKARSCKLGTAQRCAAHWGSKVDNDEAFLCGQAAVRFLMKGHSQQMVTLVRSQQDNGHTEVGVVPLAEVANGVKPFPRQWLNEDGSIGHAFIKYAYPLIQGEVSVLCEHGLPYFEDLDMRLVSPKKAIERPLLNQATHGA